MGALTDNAGDMFEDPAALFNDLAALRVRKDFPYNAKFDALVVSRYEDIVQVLNHPDKFSSDPTVPHPPAFVTNQIASKCPMRGTLLGLDNPDHDRLRRSVSTFFVPRRLRRFEPIIERLAHQILNMFVQEGHANIKAAFALPLPLQVISLIAGLDVERWQWVGRSLALFGGHADFATGTVEEKIAGIVELHEHIAELIRIRKFDRKDDLISHIWDERDNGTVQMTDFEHLSMIPGLLLAGHETTTNLLTMGLAHLLSRGLWQQANQDDFLRAATIEELVRFESAITGMKREVRQEFKLGGTVLHAGDKLFLAYNSGSRQSDIFPRADEVLLNRKITTQHLGFGRGVHACLGAPLARLLLKIEMRVLYERLPQLRLVTPHDEIQYYPVHEGRGIVALEVAWDSREIRTMSWPVPVSEELFQNGRKQTQQEVLISKIRSLADEIIEVTFTPKSGRTLPAWTPGAHIDVPVGTLGHRQYSLCGTSGDDAQYQIAVLREGTGSTGGSHYIHDKLREGQEIIVRGPRNHFALRPAKNYMFIAGGIGITAIKPMLETASLQGISYRAVYLGSSRSAMAYVEEIDQDPCVKIWPKDEMLGRFDLSSLKSQLDHNTLIYCCGPPRLLDMVERLFADAPLDTLNIERFENKSANLEASSNKLFDVLLKRSGRKLHVPADRTLLEVLNQNGVGVMSTCAKGTCGTCEINVIEGVPEHRDSVLTALERLEGKTMMACVSRCIGPRLALDLW
jgi:cytochrome P450/ferredoxin-NADP reductase